MKITRTKFNCEGEKWVWRKTRTWINGFFIMEGLIRFNKTYEELKLKG